jgi:uncharacterized protein (DUF2141 family)
MRRQPWFKKPASQRPAGKRSKNTLKLESLESRRLLAADLVSLSPLDNAADVDPNSNLVLTFSGDVKPGPGAGRLLIMNATDGSLVEAVDVSDPARVTFSGATVTVDPVNPLPSDAKLYVTLDPGAIRDTATTKANGVLFSENFETAKLKDSPIDNPGLNNAAVFLEGTLDVTKAGDYRFLSRSDDGAYLVIDLDQDGVADYDDAAELVILDNTTHGLKDVFSEFTIPLEVGQYKFEYMYFNGNGGSAAELMYAQDPNADLFTYDATKFALVGDGTQGIGITDELIKATTYATELEPDVWLADIDTARALRDDGAELLEGYPVSATIKTADVWSAGANKGYYLDTTNIIPGQPAPPVDDQDYNDQMPAGWSKETNKPQPQPVYDGWTQLNKDFWIAEQGGQSRELWTNGSGTVAVMDPDAFDDYSTINDGAEPEHDLEAYTTLPAIDLTDVTANTVKLNFDSSFRPESVGNLNDEHPDWIGQTALVDVSFDNGETWTNVLVKNSENSGPDGSTAYVDEQLSVDIPNPAGGVMLVRFAIVNSQNNWWWAVDNIVISGEAVGALNAGIVGSTETWSFNTKGSTQNPLAGDFNNDGKVDLSDFGILKENFGTGTTAAQGDANGDAKIDLTDFGILKENFGKTAPAAVAIAPPAAVAEATDYLFAVGVAQAAQSVSNVDPFADDTL